MKIKKITAVFLTLSLCIGIFAACSKKTEETSESATEATTESTTEETTTEATTAETTEETEAVDPLYDPSNPNAVNPISGLQNMDPDNVGRRSVAVVVNNCHAAMPQRGISQADAIYEYETEGGQTRLLCVFADVNTIPVIGSLRSARIVASDLAAGTNSVFIHYGRNSRVPDHLSEFGIDHVDGNDCSASYLNTANINDGTSSLPGGTFFWRDNNWRSAGRATEHTAVSNGNYIAAGIENRGIDMEGETPMLFNYVPDNSSDLANYGVPCTELNVYFSPTNDDALFEYDAATGLYSKSQYGGSPQIDETTGEQLAVTNIIVIYTHTVSHGDTTVDVHFEFAGNGWYCSDGKIMPITWVKDQPNDLIVIYNEDGEEVEVNRGVTYICVVDNDYEDMITFEGMDQVVDIADE